MSSPFHANGSVSTSGLAAPFIELRGLSKRFGGVTAVDELNLQIQRHELFALLGSSGCGKSTLMRMLAGLEQPSAGRIIIDGEDLAGVPPYRRPVGMMFQSYALFPHMDVASNIAYGLKQERLPRTLIQQRVDQMLALVQMERYAHRMPDQLSGGQQQRVALARSLAKRPKLLLLDEPLSALDRKIRRQTQLELVKTLAAVGATCIMVTHDQDEAMSMASRLAVMNEGRIEQVGTPRDVYEFPNSRFCAEFIGSTNLFDATLSADGVDHALFTSPGLPDPLRTGHGITGPLGMQACISVRPEHLQLSAVAPAQTHNRAQGRIVNLAFQGHVVQCQVELGASGGPGRAVGCLCTPQALTDNPALRLGAPVWISWCEQHGVLLTR